MVSKKYVVRSRTEKTWQGLSVVELAKNEHKSVSDLLTKVLCLRDTHFPSRSILDQLDLR